MGPRTILPFALLGFMLAVFDAGPASAQWPAGTGKCRPLAPASDEFKELIGKKVFPKIIVDDVSFDGPTLMPRSFRERLAGVLKHQELDADPHWIDEVEQTVRGAWQDEGYFSVRVRVQSSSLGGDSTYQSFRLSIHVDEGLQYRLGDLQFRALTTDASIADPALEVEGRKMSVGARGAQPMYRADHLVFPVEVLRNLIPIKEGEIFSAAKIRDGLEALRKFYANKGYIDFTPEPQTELDNANQRINLTMVLSQQKPYRVGKVEVVGIDSHTEALLKSLIKAGELYNNELIRRILTANRSSMPDDFSPEDLELYKHVREGTVDLRFNFQGCPQVPD